LPHPTGRILVLDDDASTCELLEEVLTRAGAEVERFPLRVRAIARIVVTDLGMPEMSGLEVCERARSGCAPTCRSSCSRGARGACATQCGAKSRRRRRSPQDPAQRVRHERCYSEAATPPVADAGPVRRAPHAPRNAPPDARLRMDVGVAAAPLSRLRGNGGLSAGERWRLRELRHATLGVAAHLRRLAPSHERRAQDGLRSLAPSGVFERASAQGRGQFLSGSPRTRRRNCRVRSVRRAV
jgi:hypothetical protein